MPCDETDDVPLALGAPEEAIISRPTTLKSLDTNPGDVTLPEYALPESSLFLDYSGYWKLFYELSGKLFVPGAVY